jgi:hypothetical protein
VTCSAKFAGRFENRSRPEWCCALPQTLSLSRMLVFAAAALRPASDVSGDGWRGADFDDKSRKPAKTPLAHRPRPSRCKDPIQEMGS